jgi:hypothetical protein
VAERHAERGQAAAADVRQHHRQVGEHAVHLPADHRSHRRRAAAVGHMQQA